MNKYSIKELMGVVDGKVITWEQFKIDFIQVIGSAGKTTTKEIIGTVH